MTQFTRRVIEVIRAIPPGQVMTYGHVAAAAGSPGSARGVVWILHSSSLRADLPWHRVLGAGGRILLGADAGGDQQRAALAAEGVKPGRDGAVDMRRYACRAGGRGRARRGT